MIAQVPDPNGSIRLVYQRPPQAFIDSMTAMNVRLNTTFLGCKLTHKGTMASMASLDAWLDKRDEWRAE